MEYQSDKKYLFLADREYAPLVYRFKNKNPDLKMSLLTPKEFYDKASCSFEDGVYAFLMKKEWDYSDIRNLLKILRVADLRESEKLSSLYQEIEANGYLKKDPYGLMEIRQYEKVFVLEAQEDSELHGFLDRNGISYQDITLEEDIMPYLTSEVVDNFNPMDYPKIVDDKKVTSPTPIETLLFPNRYIQYFNYFSRVRALILADEANKDTDLYQDLQHRIVFLVSDESEAYYLSLFADLFEIPVMLKIRKPFITYPEVKQRIDTIFQTRSFALEEKENLTPQEMTLQSLIESYDLASLPSFDFAYANLLEIISDHETLEILTTKGVSCTNRLDFDPDAFFFVTCFQQGDFYQYHDDKNIYSDSELVRLGVNPSYVLTALDRRKKLNFLRYNRILSLSRVKQHLSDAIYDAQFMDEFQMKYSSGGFALENGSYTKKARDLYLCYIKDENHVKRDGDEDYKSYSHAFTGIHKPIERKGKKKNTYGVTEIESYVRCPYAYYLDKYLGLNKDDPNDDKHDRWLGQFTHQMFQYIFDEDFDFDKVYEEAKDAYIRNMEKDGQKYGPYEETVMSLTKYWFRKVTTLLRQQCQNGNMNLDEHPNVEKTFENSVSYQISDGTKTYDFVGQIDKLIYTKGDGPDKFYTIVDYKSGKEVFDYKTVFLGLSIQLPFYYYALLSKENEKLRNYGVFGGFGIQHIYQNSPKGFFTKNNIKNLSNFYAWTRLTGISKASISYVGSFDQTCISTPKKKNKNDQPEPKVRNGQFLCLKWTYNGDDSPFCESSSYTFKEMIEDAKKATIHVLHAMEKNDFPIHPSATDKDGNMTMCKYCVFSDICYHDKNDTNALYKQMAYKFNLFDSNRNDDPDGDEGQED